MALEHRFLPGAKLYPSRQLRVIGGMVYLDAECRRRGLDPRSVLAAYGDRIAAIRRDGYQPGFAPRIEVITSERSDWFWDLAAETAPDIPEPVQTEAEAAADDVELAEAWVAAACDDAGIFLGEDPATDADIADRIDAYRTMFAAERATFGRRLLQQEREHLDRRLVSGNDTPGVCECKGCTASIADWEIAA